MEIRDLGTIREEHKVSGRERPKSRPSVERSKEFFSVGGESLRNSGCGTLSGRQEKRVLGARGSVSQGLVPPSLLLRVLGQCSPVLDLGCPMCMRGLGAPQGQSPVSSESGSHAPT